jgi:hypothetical protein
MCRSMGTGNQLIVEIIQKLICVFFISTCISLILLEGSIYLTEERNESKGPDLDFNEDLQFIMKFSFYPNKIQKVIIILII